MFSKYKKDAPAKAAAPAPKVEEAPKPDAPKKIARKANTSVAAVVPMDKERKKKERMGEIKLELHRALLDNLNLSALESATEADLRQEIQAISGEFLQEKNIILNREDRQVLNQELFDEVMGLGPLETLLQDETVNDILVNGPQQIFVERAGKL
ncbi:MAG: CpaF family protein, partial [Pseudomonadota bacterium]